MTPRPEEDVTAPDGLSDTERAVRDEIVRQLSREGGIVPGDVMLRFIRGYHYETPRGQKTFEYLRRALDWRKKEGVDSFLSGNAPRDLVQSGPQFRRAWHGDVYGSLPDGQPLFVHRLGRVDPESLLAIFSADQIQKHYVRDMELVTMRKRELSEQLGKMVYRHW